MVDIIVSNAGFTERALIEDITTEHFEKSFNLMARAPVIQLVFLVADGPDDDRGRIAETFDHLFELPHALRI